MTKYLIIALAILTVALGGSLWYAKALHDSNAAMVVSLHEAKEAVAVAQARTAQIQVQVQRETARANANRSLLRNALKENDEWARGATPPAVADSLCRKPAVCSPAPGGVPRATD